MNEAEISQPTKRVRPICLVATILCAIPVAISLVYMLAVYLPRNRGGSGPDQIPDFTAVGPVFVIIILSPIGSILSIASMARGEVNGGAALLLVFYTIAMFLFFVH